jgi:hypothetical protein
VARMEFESMVGAGRFGLPTSASRTLRANQTALRPEIVAILSLSVSRTLRANQTALLRDINLYLKIALLHRHF